MSEDLKLEVKEESIDSTDSDSDSEPDTPAPEPEPKVQVQKLKVDKRAKPRSEAQMAAFEKARASRAANVKAKKDAKELEIEVLTKDKQARMAAKELKKKDRSSDQLRQAEAKIMKLKKKIAKSKLPAEPKKKYYSSESESDEEELPSGAERKWRELLQRDGGCFKAPALDTSGKKLFLEHDGFVDFCAEVLGRAHEMPSSVPTTETRVLVTCHKHISCSMDIAAQRHGQDCHSQMAVGGTSLSQCA